MTHLAWIVCWTSAILLVHVFVGYPLWVWLLSRLRPLPVAKRGILPTVSIVVAVHDGAGFIRAKLASLQQLDYPAELIDIVIACDGCHDATRNNARRCSGCGSSSDSLPPPTSTCWWRARRGPARNSSR